MNMKNNIYKKCLDLMMADSDIIEGKMSYSGKLKKCKDGQNPPLKSSFKRPPPPGGSGGAKLNFGDNDKLGDAIANLSHEQRQELAEYLFEKYGIIGGY